jgi:hypothetical protein
MFDRIDLERAALSQINVQHMVDDSKVIIEISAQIMAENRKKHDD